MDTKADSEDWIHIFLFFVLYILGGKFWDFYQICFKLITLYFFLKRFLYSIVHGQSIDERRKQLIEEQEIWFVEEIEIWFIEEREVWFIDEREIWFVEEREIWIIFLFQEFS